MTENPVHTLSCHSLLVGDDRLIPELLRGQVQKIVDRLNVIDCQEKPMVHRWLLLFIALCHCELNAENSINVIFSAQLRPFVVSERRGSVCHRRFRESTVLDPRHDVF